MVVGLPFWRRLMFAAALVAFVAAVQQQGAADSSGFDVKTTAVLGFRPEYSDVQQGALGDCFFLAAVAAIAHTRPWVLERLVTRAGGGDADGPGVYTVLFNLDGEPRRVSVSDKIPAFVDPNGAEIIAAAMPVRSSALALWPAIVEKAYAKLFGSYWAIESGMSIEAFKVVSKAPVYIMRQLSWRFWRLPKLAKFLERAVERGWPLVASSSRDAAEIGLCSNHAHAVLGIYKADGPDGAIEAVKVYNLKSENSYIGELKEEAAGGVVWLTFQEFGRYMGLVRYAKIEDDYTHVARTIPAGQAVLSLKTTSRRPFWVNLEWASSRIFAHRCGIKNVPSPRAKLEVVPAGPSGHPRVAGKKGLNNVQWSVSNLQAEVTAGPGEYRVSAWTDFGGWEAVVRDVRVTVYHHKDARVELSVSERRLSRRLRWSLRSARLSRLARRADRGDQAEEAVLPAPLRARMLEALRLQEEVNRSRCTPATLKEAQARLEALDNFDELLGGGEDAMFPETPGSWGAAVLEGSRVEWLRGAAIRALLMR